MPSSMSSRSPSKRLLFYHPAIWWLNQRIRTEREHCCDDMAIALCGNAVEYARALTLMEEWRSAPVLAMAANRGPLSGRIIRLLGLNQVRSTQPPSWTHRRLLCLGAALIAGKALLRIASPEADGPCQCQLARAPCRY